MKSWMMGPRGGLGNSQAHEAKAVNIQEETQELKVWDEADALKRLGGKKELLHKIMQSFVNESGRMMSALKEAIAAGDLSGVQLHSHSIKGSSANMSCHQVHALAKMMEFSGKNGDKRVIKEGYVNLEKAMDEVCALFEKELTQGVKPLARKKRLDPLQMAVKLQNLKKEIQSGIFLDTDSLGLFGEYGDEVFTARMNSLKNYIDRFDTAEALALLETIIAELE